MKMRDGFVSNSSSSSFLIVGFEANADQIRAYEEAESKAPDGYYEDGEDKHGVSRITETDLLGFKMYIEEYSTGSISFEDVQKYEKKLKKLYGKDIKVRIFAGSEIC